VEVTNVDTKEVTIYSSIGGAARTLGYHQASVSLYLKENRFGLTFFLIISQQKLCRKKVKLLRSG
jgi:hypothetical protein